MSLLMQALKKAEHAKQHAEHAVETPPQQPPAPSSAEYTLAPIDHAAGNPPANQDAPLPVAPTGDTGLPNPPGAARSSAFDKPLPLLDLEPIPPADLAPVGVPQPEPTESPLADAAAPTTALDPVAQVIAPPEPALTPEPALRDRPSPNAAAKPIVAPPEPASLGKAETTQAVAMAAATRQTAKAVFAAKQPAAKRRGFRIAVIGAVLVLCGGIGFAYLYLQGMGHTSNVLAQPNAGAAAAPPATPPTSMPASAPTEPAASQASMSASAPPPAAVSAAAPPVGQPPLPPALGEASTAANAPTLKGESTVAETKPELPKPMAKPVDHNGIQIRQSNLAGSINPALSSAYQAYMAGDSNTAQRQYQQVLQVDPGNRDALLGLAAISLLRNQPTQAAAHYLRLLELDPNDPEAIAGLTGLQGGGLEQHESRLKKLQTLHPNAASIQFALGNLYAQHSRWAEAQQAYFQAYGAAQANADYAFNLAVSLDRLGQSKLALEYYQRALSLSQTAPGGFSKNAAQSRIRDLQAAEN